MELQFGKRVTVETDKEGNQRRTSESFSGGEQTKKEISYSIPVVVEDKSQLLSEIIKAIDLITDKKIHTLKLTIHANEDFELKMITKEYFVEVQRKI